MRRSASVASLGALGAADPGIGVQQIQQFLQGGLFVVDGERAQHERGV